MLRSVVRHGSAVYDASVVLATLALVTAGVLLVIQWHVVPRRRADSTLGGMVRVDGFAVFLAA